MQRQNESKQKGTKRRHDQLSMKEIATGLAGAAASIPDNASVITDDTQDDTQSIATALSQPKRMELEPITETISSASSFAGISRALTAAASTLPDNDNASVISEQSMASTITRQSLEEPLRMQIPLSGAGAGAGAGSSSGQQQTGSSSLHTRRQDPYPGPGETASRNPRLDSSYYDEDDDLEITPDDDWQDLLQKRNMKIIPLKMLSQELESVASIVEGIAGPRIKTYYSDRISADRNTPLQIREKYIKDLNQLAVRHWLRERSAYYEQKETTPPTSHDFLKNKAESIKLLENYFCPDSYQQCALVSKGKQVYEILYGRHSNEGMDLATFLLLNLAVGDAFTYRLDKEISPENFVDLTHPFLQMHAEFAPLKFSSRENAEAQLRLKLTEKKATEESESKTKSAADYPFHLYLALGAQQVVDGFPVTFHLNLIMTVQSQIDNKYHHMQLFGLDAAAVPRLIDSKGNRLDFDFLSEKGSMVASLMTIANQLQSMAVERPDILYRRPAQRTPLAAAPQPRYEATQTEEEGDKAVKRRRLSPEGS